MQVDPEHYLAEGASSHPFLNTVPKEEVGRAISTCCGLFSKSISPVFKGTLELKVGDKHTDSINALDEVIPGLVFAHRYFGDEFPKGLVDKLKNPPQCADTLFELKCLGILSGRNAAVVYEPQLLTQKVPDFKLILDNSTEVYVECKTQGMRNTEFLKTFSSACNRIGDALKGIGFISSAWSKGLRTEVLPSKTLGAAEIEALALALQKTGPEFCAEQKHVIPGASIICVPRRNPPITETTMKQGRVTVGTTPVSLGHENTELLIHSWPNLDVQRRRSQRKLLAAARRQLRGIPEGSLGMICIQTFAAGLFLPDIEKLLGQRSFNSIPFVWLNPFHEGKIVCRTNFLDLRNRLFEGLITPGSP